MTMEEKDKDSAEASQDVAVLRPGRGQSGARSEFQRAEAETVMFASARALPLAYDTNGLAAPDVRPPAIHVQRVWLTKAMLLLILLLQAGLTLRMRNTAFEDEALYLYVGHLEIAHLLHGASLQGNYPSYFSGAPVLYPVLGALADSIGGLTAARAVSLIEMLAATALLYGMTRRLFNDRVALCAAIVFAVSEPTLFLGNLATYDASALFLLAVAAWIVVRAAESRWPLYLLAAPVMVLAVATKYASFLFVPCVIVLAGIAAWPRRGRRALIPPIALTVATAALLAGVLFVAGSDYIKGIDVTTLARNGGNTPIPSLLWDCALWIGIPFALAVVGVVAYAIKPTIESHEEMAFAGTRMQRIVLGVVLAGSALLAPAEQMRIHTFVSLQKHVGFGLLFAAPIIGFGLAWIIGDHFRRTQIGVAVAGAALAVGMVQADNLFHAWSNTSVLVADMTHYLRPGAHYLVEVDEVPIYYLRNHADAQPDQFTSTYFSGYTTKQGQFLTGNAGFVAAIQAGYYQMIVFDYSTTPSADTAIARALAANPDYRLAEAIPIGNTTERQYLWVKTG
jgi:Dolichyl-phosphate-mannose-protein mannosyltransferase